MDWIDGHDQFIGQLIKGKKMNKYNVLITINEYVEIEAETPEDAEMEAYRAFKHGEIEIDQYPIFVCEAADLIEDDENV